MAEPFFKWAGGKRWIAQEILTHLPAKITGRYFEPFLGGGAVFFEAARLGMIESGAAILSDANPDLIAAYAAAQDPADRAILTHRLARYMADDGKLHYLEVRARDPITLAGVDRAARFLYLVRTGFNGLWRTSRAGRYNVPWGKRPFCVDEAAFQKLKDSIEAAGRVLSAYVGAIECRDFAQALEMAGPGDAVYLDPPYLPRSRTASFTAYAGGGFGIADHKRLAACALAAAGRGAIVLLSNSDTPETRRIYQGDVFEYPTRHRIAAKGAARAEAADEVVIRIC